MTREDESLWFYDLAQEYIGKTTVSGYMLANFYPGDPTMRDLAWNGEHLWTINTSGVFKKFDTSGSLLQTVSGVLTGGWGLTFDGTYLWVSDPGADRIYHISLLDDTEPPGPPIITSTTHPIEPIWYKNPNPVFSWTPPADPSGISGYSYILDIIPETIPDMIIDGSETMVSYFSLPSGVWYFHCRARDGAGTWGETDHFRIQIDTTPPTDGTILIANGADTTQTLLVPLGGLNAEDEHSGMGYGSAMRFSNDGLIWSDEEPFAVSRSDWDLSQSGGNDPSGVKSVSVTFKDVVGNWSDPFFDEIVYSAPLQIITTSLSEGTVGIPYAETLSAAGGWPPYDWEIADGELPPGLTFSVSGVISGLPDFPGTFHFTVRVIDSNMNSVMKNLSIPIDDSPVEALVILFIPTVYGLPGHQVHVTVNLDNETQNTEPVAGLEVKFTFPFDLLTVLEIFPTARTTHMDFFSWNEPDPGRINILLSDFSADVIAPGIGAVIGMTCDISEDALEGDSLLFHFTRVVLSDGNADSIPSIVSDGFLIVGPGEVITGDANLDGEIDILDVVFMANIIIEQVEPSMEQLQAADCNRDGTLNVLDLVGVVNIILGIGSCPPG